VVIDTNFRDFCLSKCKTDFAQHKKAAINTPLICAEIFVALIIDFYLVEVKKISYTKSAVLKIVRHSVFLTFSAGSITFFRLF